MSTSVFHRYALSLHQHPDAGVYAENDCNLVARGQQKSLVLRMTVEIAQVSNSCYLDLEWQIVRCDIQYRALRSQSDLQKLAEHTSGKIRNLYLQ